MPAQPDNTNADPNVSVVIPSVESNLVGVTLDSLRDQDTTLSYEVVVIGTDASGQLQRRDDIRFIETDRPLSAGANRNIGIKEARGQYVLFTDADCRVHPNWMNMLTGRLAQGYRMVGGAFDFPKTNYWVTGDNMAILHDLSPAMPGGEVEIRVGGGNMGLWRDVLVELDGFDETFRGGQDNDLALRLMKAGHKVYFEPRAIVEHLPQEGTLAWLARHATGYGRASLALIERHPEYYGWQRLKKLWRWKWVFLLWSPLKAMHQASTVFSKNRAWRRYLHVWPAVWLFYFLRRVAIARGVHELLAKGEL